jgi:hypothetical protein
MVAGLFGSAQSGDHGTANELMDAAKMTKIVSTAPAVKEYRNISKGEVEQYKERVKQEAEFTRNWNQYLQLNLKHQELDTQRTQDWASWRVATFKHLTQKGLIITKQVAAQQVIGAQAQQASQQIQQSAQERINQLQQTKSAARDRLRR